MSDFRAGALSLAALAGTCCLAVADDPVQMRAVEALTFPTEAGAAYALEGSLDESAWVRVGEPIFGDGQPARYFLTDPVQWPHYRVAALDPAVLGVAPVTLADTTVLLNDQGRDRQVVFLTGERGILKTDLLRARTFTWTLRKTAPDNATVDLTFGNGDHAILELDFSVAAGGAYALRTVGAAGMVLDREAGGFSVQRGRVRQRTAGASLPASVEGKSMILTEAGGTTALQFLNSTSVQVVRPDGTSATLPFTWEVESPGSAVLDISGPNDRLTRYTMGQSFRGGGSFTRQRFAEDGGNLVPLDNGTAGSGGFSIPSDPEPPPNPDCPPEDLTDLAFRLSGSDSLLLKFNADGTGTATRENGGSVEVTPFEYDYDRSGGNGGTLTLTFPGAVNDAIEDYDFDFSADCAGSYTKNSYENGQATVAESGSFTPGSAAKPN